MEGLLFKVSLRNEKGRKVRNEGFMPCVVYGDNTHKATSIKMTMKEFNRLLTYPKSSIISLDINGVVKKCVVKNLQRNHFGHINHIDFEYVRAGEAISLMMPITYIGESALEAKDKRLEVILSEIELKGDPTKFPKHIEVDVSNYEIGKQIFLSQIENLSQVLPEGQGDIEIAKVLSNYNKKNDSENEEESDK